MPTNGDVEVSAEEANQAVVVAPPTGDPEGDLPTLPPLKKIWDCSKVENGPAVQKKVKPTDGDAATVARYFILFPSRALRIILYKKIFKSDLILPCPPRILLQDSGVWPQDHGRGRRRYITAVVHTVVICGPGITASGVQPQGATVMLTKVSSRVLCCIFPALV